MKWLSILILNVILILTVLTNNMNCIYDQVIARNFFSVLYVSVILNLVLTLVVLLFLFSVMTLSFTPWPALFSSYSIGWEAHVTARPITLLVFLTVWLILSQQSCLLVWLPVIIRFSSMKTRPHFLITLNDQKYLVDN